MKSLTYIRQQLSEAERHALYSDWYERRQREGSYVSTAEEYGTNSEIISKIVRRWVKSSNKLAPVNARSNRLLELPQFSEPLIDQPLEIHSDNCLITSDWETPDVHPIVVKAAFLVAIKYNLRRHIINGDFISNDAAGVNSYDPLWASDYESRGFDRQMTVANQLAWGMQQWFTDGVDCTYGNHEDKLNRATKGAVSVQHMRLGSMMNITRYPYLWLKTSRGYAFIAHPANYSPNPVLLGKRLYNKMLAPDGNKPRYVIIGHTHQYQEGYTEDGSCLVSATGCMRNYDTTPYLQRKVTTFPRWNNSFVAIVNGYVKSFKLLDHDWKAELGDMYPYLYEPIPLSSVA